jgi:hypothetical protein
MISTPGSHFLLKHLDQGRLTMDLPLFRSTQFEGRSFQETSIFIVTFLSILLIFSSSYSPSCSNLCCLMMLNL